MIDVSAALVRVQVAFLVLFATAAPARVVAPGPGRLDHLLYRTVVFAANLVDRDRVFGGDIGSHAGALGAEFPKLLMAAGRDQTAVLLEQRHGELAIATLHHP